MMSDKGELSTHTQAKTQKNKATSFHLGQLKAKLAKLKRELLTPSSGGGGGGGAGFDVPKTGIASVGFIGCEQSPWSFLPITKRAVLNPRRCSPSSTEQFRPSESPPS